MAWTRFGCFTLFAVITLGCGGSKSSDDATGGAGSAGAAGGGGTGAGGVGGSAASGGAIEAGTPKVDFQVGDAQVETAFWGDPYFVRVTGLSPHQTVTLKSRADVIDQTELEASATFEAADDGSVDVSRDAPSSGTYSGVDSDGLVWSEVEATDGNDELEFNVFDVRVEADGAEIARGSLNRYYVSKDVVQVDVKDNGLVGKYYAP